MRVLFISRSHPDSGISPIIINQGESLRKMGIDLQFYGISGKGIKAYVKHIFLIQKFLKKNKFDIVHSHYSFSAFTASLAGSKPHIVSLMGSDVKSSALERFFIRLFNAFFWDACIVKSTDMQESSGLVKSIVIPNGVDLDTFRVTDKFEARKQLGWESNKKYLLFIGNPERFEKNFSLSDKAHKLLQDPLVDIKAVFGIRNDELYTYYNAADLLLMTSLWEGSPNAVKEALACNCPVVSTDVGDVKANIEGLEGCYITSYEPGDIAEKVKLSLKNPSKINGRQRLLEYGLDSVSIARKIHVLYNKTISIYKVIYLIHIFFSFSNI